MDVICVCLRCYIAELIILIYGNLLGSQEWHVIKQNTNQVFNPIMTYFKWLIPACNLGPINYLIWIEQLNGYILFPVICVRIATFLSPFPLSSLVASDFGPIFSLIAFIGLVGGSLWNFCIALYRWLDFHFYCLRDF